MCDDEKCGLNKMLGYEEIGTGQGVQFEVVKTSDLRKASAKGARILSTWVEPKFDYHGETRVFLLKLTEKASLALAALEVEKAKKESQDNYDRFAEAEKARKLLVKENAELEDCIQGFRMRIHDLKSQIPAQSSEEDGPASDDL